MNVAAEKVYKIDESYVRIKFFEDGNYEEIPITEGEYLKAIHQQHASEDLDERETDKFNSPIGFHDDGRKMTEEEAEKLRKWLYSSD